MDAEIAEMLRSSLQHVLTEQSPRSLAQRLDELGWSDVLDDDAPAALEMLFDVKGRTLSGADALGPLLAKVLADRLSDDRVASSSVVLPATLQADDRTTIDAAGTVSIDGIACSSPEPGTMVTAPVATFGGTSLAMTALPATAARESLANTDPDLGLTRVRFTVPRSDVVWFLGPDADAAWAAAVTAGRWATSAELVGVARSVIEQAVAYTGQRFQYGRAIGSFQALQHRLASAHASIVAASHVVTEAAQTQSAWVALVAKALTGRAAEYACTQAQQCYGAIGFTWEHEFHRSLRRTYQLDRLLGDYRNLEVEIGRQLQDQRSVPKIGVF